MKVNCTWSSPQALDYFHFVLEEFKRFQIHNRIWCNRINFNQNISTLFSLEGFGKDLSLDNNEVRKYLSHTQE